MTHKCFNQVDGSGVRVKHLIQHSNTLLHLFEQSILLIKLLKNGQQSILETSTLIVCRFFPLMSGYVPPFNLQYFLVQFIQLGLQWDQRGVPLHFLISLSQLAISYITYAQNIFLRQRIKKNITKNKVTRPTTKKNKTQLN